MTVFDKQLMVAFYVLEPSEPDPTWEAPGYPLDEVWKRISRLDPALDSYRIKEDLFGGETLCLLYEDGPKPLLGAFYKDKFQIPLTERKGEVREIVFDDDDEGIVDASYVMFFEEDLVGVIRTSSKSPGHVKIGQWLSVIGGHRVWLAPMPDANTTRQLDKAQSTRLRLLVGKPFLNLIDTEAPSAAKALREAASLNPHSNAVGVEHRAGRDAHEVALFSATTRDLVTELLPFLSDFEIAEVKLQGRRRPVNLARSSLVAKVDLHLIDHKRVRPEDAAKALLEAYEDERAALGDALAAWRARRGSAD